ncbi:MAG: hypothetical protein HOL61_15425 [Rhodospirillaceae bacterium]|jgi:hypothetical protein|nr:hypothetical protein [Rhodospirillaceae bacterium]MBT5567407.1 hypothetical protein [Rhodospirillaceae bacterium]
MRPVTQFVYYTFFVSVLASPALAQSEIPTIQIPEEYLVGNAPASVASQSSEPTPQVEGASAFEGANALNGTLYAVIAPTFDGSNVTTSFFGL